jgi:hypothetical protein
MVERYRVRTDHYPSWILADKIYRNRDRKCGMGLIVTKLE